MAKTGARVKKRILGKIAIILIAGIAAIGSIVYWKRYEIAVWYMEGNKKAQEIIILQMLEIAKPVIQKDFTMTLFEKIYSTMAGNRNEKERQTGALKDVRTFCETSFKSHWLKFEDVHHLSSLKGFDLQGFDFALAWKREKADEVLAAFEVNFWSRVIDRMQINQNCSFFTEMRLYVEKRAKVN